MHVSLRASCSPTCRNIWGSLGLCPLVTEPWGQDGLVSQSCLVASGRNHFCCLGGVGSEQWDTKGDSQNGDRRVVRFAPWPHANSLPSCHRFKAPGKGGPASNQDGLSHTFAWGHGRTRSFIEGGHHDTPKLCAMRASLKQKPGAIKHDCSGPQ